MQGTFMFFMAMASFHQNYSYTPIDAQKAAQQIEQQVPFGRTMGTNADGKCVVIYGSMPDVDPDMIDYQRAQVLNGYNEATATYESLVDAEIIVSGPKGSVKGLQASKSVKIVSGKGSITASADPQNLSNAVVTVEKNGKTLSCSVPKSQPN